MNDTGDFDLVSSRDQLAIMVTRRCNMTCSHCSVESGPKVGGEPVEAELLGWLRQTAGAGVRMVRITGGEPMLRAPLVLRLLEECRRLGVKSTMTTNGYWGRTAHQARRQLRALRRAGLGSLVVSYDKYHADFQGPGPVRHIASAARRLGLPMSVTMVRSQDDPPNLIEILNDTEVNAGARVRTYDLQPVGRGRELLAPTHAGDTEGFCTAAWFPAITDDGRAIACNGPAYFERETSPLVLGSLRERPLHALLEKHEADPILETIRTHGPAGLRDQLRKLPGFEQFPFRSTYRGICDLCHDLTRNDAAVRALRRHLTRPDLVAVRHAARQVITGNRRDGALSGSFVNGVGACRVFLGAAWHPDAPFDNDAARILGSAHLDWRRLAHYLGGCGLARPLASALEHREVARWAPPFFISAMRQRAVADGLRELVQRDILGQISEELRGLRGTGLLLKGGAMLAAGMSRGRVPRATADIDLLVAPGLAPRLRARLIARGFTPSVEGGATYHHLAPVRAQGVTVEIHTRMMAGFWGLPERELVADARPTSDWDVLSALGSEGLIFHATVHASASFYSFGLKTAWDIRVIDEAAGPIDWNRIARWASMLPAPRAFWVPLNVLAPELDLNVPPAFLRQAPADPGGRRAEEVARQRLFRATEAFADLDVASKAGVMLLLHHNVAGRARYLAAKLWWRGVRPSTWGAAIGRARRADVFRQAWRNYQRYRRSVR
jgi:hypothetical protein